MAATGFIHHIGTFLLFAASILLLITTISSPVINDISLLKVTLTNQSSIRHSSITFGTFGYCVLDVAGPKSDQDSCTGSHIGYNPAAVISTVDRTSFNEASRDTTRGLTRVMVLHPIVCGLSFIAFLLALGSGIFGALLASLMAALTWALTVVVMATDFVWIAIIRNHINDHGKDKSGSKAKFGPALWTEVAAMICLFFAMFIVLFSCCSKRRHKRDSRVVKNETAYGTPVTTRRRFWQRRSRY